jgi:ubiquitin carboxyl-terminal hydrolase 12/46
MLCDFIPAVLLAKRRETLPFSCLTLVRQSLVWQEAHKRMRVKRLPTILALHLKRFKYVEQYNRHIKVIKKIIKI